MVPQKCGKGIKKAEDIWDSNEAGMNHVHKII
jgi:hypothetical protein